MSKQKKSMSVIENVFREVLQGTRHIKSMPPTRRNLAFCRDEPRQIEMYNTAMVDRLLIDVDNWSLGDVPESDINIWHKLYPEKFWLKHFDEYNRDLCTKNVLQFTWLKKPLYYIKQTPPDKQNLPQKFG